MRRANLELKDRAGIIAVLEESDVCRIGMYADGEVYIVPMNFGYELSDAGMLTLYFHCAGEGRKLDMIAKNPEVCFEMDTGHFLVRDESGNAVNGKGSDACSYLMHYSSIIGNGRIEIITDHEDKISALTQLMKHYSDEDSFEFNEKTLARTTVLRLTSTSFTAKKNNAD